MKSEHYHHIIIDFDGTLFDSHKAVITSLQKTLDHFEQSYDPLSIEKLIQQGLSLKGMLDNLIQKEDIPFETMREFYLKAHTLDIIEYGRWYPDALEWLDLLSHNSEVWIVSNRQQVTLDVVCQHYNIHQPQKILGSQPKQPIKPQKEPFSSHLTEDLKSPNIRRLVIGDTLVDIQFAQTLNCDAAWAAYGYGQLKAAKHLPIKFIWNNIKESIKDLLA